MKSEKDKTPRQGDEIQAMMAQMEAGMPEVKYQLDRLELPLPPSLHTPPHPESSASWLDRLGRWTVCPGGKIPDALATTGGTVVAMLVPLWLSLIVGPGILLLWFIERG